MASRKLTNRHARPLHLTAVGAEAAIGEGDQRGFAGTAAAEQSGALVSTELKINRLDASLQADVLKPERRTQRILPSSRPTCSIAA